MSGYLARRVLAAIVTIWLVLTVVFVIFFVLPGGSGRRVEGGYSPVAVFMAGRGNTPSTLRRIERDLHLDQPVAVQYREYLTRFVQGDLGFSYAELEQRIPVRPMLMASIRPTVELGLGASVIAIVGGAGGALVAARKRKTWTERSISGFSIVSLSVPSFVLGLLALSVLGRAGIYTRGYVPMSEGLVGWFQGMWIPWIVLAFPFIGIYFRLTRTSLREVENEEYIRTARAKGLSARSIQKHQLRAGFMPLVTAYGADLGRFLGGAIIVESIFQIPGLGSLVVGATQASDFPVVAAVTLVGAIAVVLLSLLVDIAYAYLDPRIVYAKAKS